MSALLWTIRSSSWGGLGLRPGPANSERQRERRGGLRGGRVEMQKSIKISNYFKYKSQLSSSELHDSSNKQDLLNVFTGCWRRWATALNFNILNSGRYRIHRCVKVVKCFLSTVKENTKHWTSASGAARSVFILSSPVGGEGWHVKARPDNLLSLWGTYKTSPSGLLCI